MFIESITVCGFMEEIGKAEHKFQIYKDSSVNNEISRLDGSIFVKAFSIIFDVEYGSETNFSEFINNQCKSKPFVEILLWQSDKNTLSEFKWLKGNRLTLTRYLQDPTQILVNGKSIGITSFHNTTASFGFINMKEFNMHRLLDLEIARLSHFTGEDLWNLILKMNECDDLVQVIEIKHKSRIILTDKMKVDVKEMEEVLLPAKLKLRDDLRSLFSLSKQFNTLIGIVEKRKVKVLSRQRTALKIELDQREVEVNVKGCEVSDLEVVIVTSKMKTKNKRTMMEMIQARRRDLREKLHETQINNIFLCLVDLYQRFDTLHASIRRLLMEYEQSIAACAFKLNDKQCILRADIEIVTWKNLLKSYENSNLHKVFMSQLEGKLHQEKININNMTKEVSNLDNDVEQLREMAIFAPHTDFEALKSMQEANSKSQLEFSARIFNFNSSILSNKNDLNEIELDIKSMADSGLLDSKVIETLTAISTFVMLDPTLSAEYLGPAFQYLQPLTDMEFKAWPGLSTLSLTFLFIRGTTARKVHRQLLADTLVVFDHCVFLGLDEISTTSLQPTIDGFMSADTMVRDDVAFKPVLQQLFKEVLMIEDHENVEAVEWFQKFVVVHRSGISVRSNQSVKFYNALPNIFHERVKSPISILQGVYEKIQTYVAVKKNLTKLLLIRSQVSQSQMEENQRVIDEQSKYLLSITTCLAAADQMTELMHKKWELQNRLILESSKTQKLQELLETSTEIDTWNLDQLQAEIVSMTAQLHQENELSKVVEHRACNHKMHLQVFIAKMEQQQRNVCKSVETLKSCWIYLDLSSRQSTLQSIQQNLDKLDQDLEIARQSLMAETAVNISNAHLPVESLETRCHLYEKLSENAMIEDAIKQSQSIISQCTTKPQANFDGSIYNQFAKESNEVIAEEISQCQRQIQLHKQNYLETVSTEHYGHLIESIKKIKTYSESPVSSVVKRNKLTAKAFPIMNKALVMMLKDAVCNYQMSFHAVMSNFIKKSKLFFFTQGLFEEIKHDDFTWSSFDMGRLKAMDFVVEWKKGNKGKVGTASLRKIKGLMLILHIITYLSVFKFIFIDDTFFNNMDPLLEQKIRKFLKLVLPFVQIILVKKDAHPTLEPMEIDC